MRLVPGAMAMAILISSCAPAPPLTDAPILAAAYESLRVGNDTALEQAHEAVAGRVPRDPAVLTRCDAQAYAARRLVRLRDTLAFMDNATVASMGEVVRFVYLEGLLFGLEGRDQRTVTEGWPDAFACRDAPDHRQNDRLDRREARAVRDGARTFLSDWRRDLHRRLGPDYRRQMRAAARLLAANHLRTTSSWEENGNYD